MMRLDKYKQKILDTYISTSKNISINATAGSGKTTVLVELSKRITPYKKAIFLAFNKSIAEELKTRLPEYVESSTIHGLAFKALFRHFNTIFSIDENCHFSTAKKLLKIPSKIKPKMQNAYIFSLCDAVNLSRLNCAKTYAEIEKVMKDYGQGVSKEFIDQIIELDDILDKEAIRPKSFTKIDFTDMLYLAANFVSESKLPKYDIIMVDECQDLNLLQIKFIQKILKPCGRIVSVGDIHQAIYGFQGSNVESFKILQNLPNTIQLPLSTTYRCPSLICDIANTVFDSAILAQPEAEEGCIIQEGDFLNAEKGDYIICRNNLPLFKAYFSLIKEKKPAYILGSDFQQKIPKLLSKINDRTEISDLLGETYQLLCDKGCKCPEKTDTFQSMKDKCDVLTLLFEIFGSKVGILNNIEDIFSPRENSIVLATVHKSKGLEADNVYLLDKELILSKYANSDLELYNEQCLLFVAYTRAKKQLIFCKSK